MFFTLIDTGSIPVMLAAMLLMAFVLGCTVGPQSALFAELFPAHVRYSGASLGYQVGAILGGGIAPFVATALYAEFGISTAITAYFVARQPGQPRLHPGAAAPPARRRAEAGRLTAAQLRERSD